MREPGLICERPRVLHVSEYVVAIALVVVVVVVIVVVVAMAIS